MPGGLRIVLIGTTTIIHSAVLTIYNDSYCDCIYATNMTQTPHLTKNKSKNIKNGRLNLLLRFQPLRLFSPTHCQAYCRGQPLRFFSLTPFSTYGRGLAIETLLTRLTLVMLLSSLWQDYQLHLLVIESEAGLSIPAS